MHKKIIPAHILEGFQQAKDLREEADYYNRWSQAGWGSQDGSQDVIDNYNVNNELCNNCLSQ